MGVYTELSLFSGYGGFSLGLQLAGVRSRIVCYVEIDDYCQRVIQARIRDGHLDDAPIWDDVKTFDGRPWAGLVDIVTAGFPCQPHSVAGQRKGAADDRNLWPDTLRVVSEVRPRYVLLENAGIELRNGPSPAYAYSVLADLTSIGYDAEWASAPAAAVGAPHLRWRWWCLAYTDRPRLKERRPRFDLDRRVQVLGGNGQDWSVADAGGRRRGKAERDVRERQPHASGCGSLADAKGERRQGWCNGGEGVEARPCRLFPARPGKRSGNGPLADTTCQCLDGSGGTRERGSEPANSRWWAAEPSVGRVVDGCPNRVDELRALGNGIVPAVVARFLRGC